MKPHSFTVHMPVRRARWILLALILAAYVAACAPPSSAKSQNARSGCRHGDCALVDTTSTRPVFRTLHVQHYRRAVFSWSFTCPKRDATSQMGLDISFDRNDGGFSAPKVIYLVSRMFPALKGHGIQRVALKPHKPLLMVTAFALATLRHTSVQRFNCRLHLTVRVLK